MSRRIDRGCSRLRCSLTDDAGVHCPYGPPARGRAAIEALHSIWVQHSGPNKTLQVIEAGNSGDIAWTLAAYSEGEVVGNGTSLSVFERQPGCFRHRDRRASDCAALDRTRSGKHDPCGTWATIPSPVRPPRWR